MKSAEETAREIDRAVREIVDVSFRKALEILKGRRDALEAGAQALLQKETLTEDDLREFVARLKAAA